MKNSFISGVITMVLFGLVDWLLLWDGSPARPYFLDHVELPNFWRRIESIPMIVSVMASGNFHQPSMLAYCVTALTQWFLVGFVVGLFLERHGNA